MVFTLQYKMPEATVLVLTFFESVVFISKITFLMGEYDFYCKARKALFYVFQLHLSLCTTFHGNGTRTENILLYQPNPKVASFKNEKAHYSLVIFLNSVFSKQHTYYQNGEMIFLTLHLF